MNERQKRLIEVYEHLRRYFGIHTKTGFAEALHYGRTSLSAAMNGDESYLTDNLFKNICEVYPGTFNIDYLLHGTGQLLTVQEEVTTNGIENQFNQPQSSYIDKLIASLEQQIKAKDEQIADKNHIIRLLEQKVEILEAMQHIDAENPLRSPFPVGVAEPKEQKDSLRV
jgi:hypothetical protein